uniref:Chromo domain-containing protein n=1 Tax=Panagrellus redivivus TaxID=6233 RepID=A0A7E4UX77_PANRE
MSSDDSDSEAAPQQPVGESEPEYEVDYIMKTRMHGRKRFFLVRWKGFGPEADSWEPIDMLTVGAKETVEEYMAKYNEEKKNQLQKAKKRPRATSKSTMVVDSDAIPPSSPSSEGSSNEDEFNPSGSRSRKRGPSAKRARKSTTTIPRGAASRATPRAVKTTGARAAASSSAGGSVKKPRNSVAAWLMVSSDDSDDDRTASGSASPQKPPPPAANPTPSSSAAMATTPPDDLPGPSNPNLSQAAPGSLKMTFRRPDPSASTSAPPINYLTGHPSQSANTTVPPKPLPNPSDADDAYRHDEGSSKKSKKEKKRDKKHRKNKIQLEYVGCYRPAEDRPLSFVTRQINPEVSHGDTRVYTLEEAIEIDSRSLARYLSNYITFTPSGTPIVRPPRRSTSSSYNSD